MLPMLVLGFGLAGIVGTAPICKETTCKCYEQGFIMVCPRGIQGNPKDCGRGYTLVQTDCVMAPIVREPAPIVREPAPIVREPAPIVREPAPIVRDPVPIVRDPVPIVREPAPIPNPGPTQGPALLEPDFRPDLPGHGPEPPANIPGNLDLPGPETLEIRSCETRKWTLRDILDTLKQFNQDDVNTILASITLAWALIQTVFFAICFRRKVSIHGLPPITRYHERLRLDSNSQDSDTPEETETPGEENLVHDVTVADVHADANGNAPGAAQAQATNGDILATFDPLTRAKPKVPPRPQTAMRLLTTEEMRLQTFLEKIGEGRYMQIVRSTRGRLTLAPAVYPQ